MRQLAIPSLVAALWFGLTDGSAAEMPQVTFSQSADQVQAYDFLEITATIDPPTAKNPFTDVTFTGKFHRENGPSMAIEGFSDSTQGSTYRMRFMPAQVGKYSYTVTLQQGETTRTHSGAFAATDGKRRGVLRVDHQHPWHFVWEGTGEHFFFNGNTAFLLMGWQDEKTIREVLDRQHQLKVNRLRVLLAGGRSSSFWGEPIIPNEQFRSYLDPWLAERPSDPTHPDYDYARFNVAYWQKYERLLRYARERDLIISIVLDWNDSRVHPAAASGDERRYFRYAANRLGAFCNITWDLGDDISSYRDLAWSHTMGTYLHESDPYHHLATDHPVDNRHQDRTAPWFGFTSFQEWSRPQHEWMLNQRRAQEKLGRIIPQTNEEYGYEDHYPKWAQNYPDGANANNMRLTAWEIYMAGCYQTTGETARRGTGYWPDTGGGWINGRGDDSMVMLHGYAHIVEFFTRFEWWKTDPHDELVTKGTYCLAEPGRCYAIYLPRGGRVTVRLEAGRYQANWFNPRSGATKPLPPAQGPSWTSPESPDSGDWALLLRK